MSALLRAPDAAGLTHQALLYRSVGELVAATAPFLRQGVHDGDAVVMISAPANLAAVRRALDPEERAAVTFEPSATRYRRAAHALASYQQLLNAHVDAGRRVRVVGEQPLALLEDDQVRELCRNDAAFNAVCDLPGVTVVCPYDLRSVPAHVVRDIRRSHPQVVEAGVCRPSPTYADPQALLAEECRGPPLPEPTANTAELVCPRDTGDARRFVIGESIRRGLEGSALEDFVTAANEVVTNALTHALIDTVRVWSDDGRVVCEVRDYGFGLPDLLAGYRQPQLHSAGGWGIWLVRQLTDLVELRTGPGGTVVRLHAHTG